MLYLKLILMAESSDQDRRLAQLQGPGLVALRLAVISRLIDLVKTGKGLG